MVSSTSEDDVDESQLSQPQAQGYSRNSSVTSAKILTHAQNYSHGKKPKVKLKRFNTI